VAQFSPAMFDATIEELTSGMTDLSGHLQRVGPTVNATVSNIFIPDFVADGLIWCAEKLIEIGTAVLEKIKELLLGAAAPVAFFFRAHDWRTQIGGPASGVAGSIGPNALRAPLVWTGEAATSYTRAVAGQAPAATSVESLSSTVSTALTTCAVAGLAFYVAIGLILVKLIVATIAAIVALGSVVFSWAGVALIVEEAGVNTAMIVAAVAALVALLGAQASALITVEGAAVSATAFPGGHWPVGTA